MEKIPDTHIDNLYVIIDEPIILENLDDNDLFKIFNYVELKNHFDSDL